MNNESGGWQPSCSTQVLHVRAIMLQAIRRFFQDRGYLEVDTPCLSRDVILDAWLEPYALDVRGDRWFLQTSPEAHMKRLLAAGSGSIFQISRVFRQNEHGIQHNSEFTMIEWYGVDSTWLHQIDVTESLVRTSVSAAANVTGTDVTQQWLATPFRRTTYKLAFQNAFGIDVFGSSGKQIIEAARRLNVPLPDDLREEQIDDVLNVMLAFAIEPQLGGRPIDADRNASPDSECSRIHPEFLCDYPPTQAALAVLSETHPQVARRFELYVEGMELCNGYQELTDVEELQRRDFAQNERRRAEKLPQLPGASRLLDAMQSGLPPCSGVALGFDRLVMLATQHRDIREVIPFPDDRA
ncbi:MAG: elongation factor P--(R)-beta-lysine ligase [Planctomycetota bacterium]|nr:elongation factor P--(R)-beta-lysine ligase [Planctomycetota bacterium]